MYLPPSDQECPLGWNSIAEIALLPLRRTECRRTQSRSDGRLVLVRCESLLDLNADACFADERALDCAGRAACLDQPRVEARRTIRQLAS
jgi:hypothetical protein